MTSTTDPAALLRRRGWRFRHSAWMLAVFFGFGLLSFVGFLYIALRARTRGLWIAAAVTSVASGSVWVVSWTSRSPSASTTTTASGTEDGSLTGSLAMAVWAGCIVYAFIINRSYLRWRAGASRKAWFEGAEELRRNERAPLAPPPVFAAPSAPVSVASFAEAESAAYWTPAPAAAPAAVPVAAAPVPTVVPPRVAPAAPAAVDVNRASAADLVGTGRA